MAVEVSLLLPGVPEQAYREVHAEVMASPPDGLLFHSCLVTEEGLRIRDFWERPDQFERFIESVIAPKMQARGVGGPPQDLRIVEMTNVDWPERVRAGATA